MRCCAKSASSRRGKASLCGRWWNAGRVVAETKYGPPFRLRRASFKGTGRQAGLREASWDTLRDLIYKDRGA